MAWGITLPHRAPLRSCQKGKFSVRMATNAFDELKWRGLVYDFVEGVQDLLLKEQVTIYNGFDATGDSLHVGHLVPLIALARLQRFGHHPIALAGGGTSMIGDPSGKSAERQLLSREIIAANVNSIKGQLAHFLDFDTKVNPARVINNADWLLTLNLVDFLRDVGKHFTVNYMITKDFGAHPPRARGRHLLHRVQLHAAAILRFPPPVRYHRL